MPWNNQGNNNGGPWGGGNNGGNNGGNPWGGGPQRPSGGRPNPPDFDKVINDLKNNFGGKMPGGGSSRRLILLGLIILMGLWAATGFYRVNPQQQGVVLRFGEWIRTTGPGLHYHLPFPIEQVLTPDVTRDNRLEIGFRDVAGSSATRRDIADESLMITGDENIVDIDFVVFWRISDAGEYLFNLADPDETIKVAAEAVMREIIGQTAIQTALTEGRQNVQFAVREKLQELLDDYRAGVRVREVQLLAVDPPSDVIDAFNDVQRARQDRDRLKNQAEAFRNDIVPRARGQAAQLIAEAEAYREEVMNRAKGDASRFDQVFSAYEANKDVTRERIYIETIEEVFGNIEKIIIDEDGQSVVPYLPLKELGRATQKAGE
ncbi:MAG: FtsH protease activity modulator HflK [Candidatus Puniceispirillaceae bacterium]